MRADNSVTADGKNGKDVTDTAATILPEAFRLVGVGASAGGLKALKAFFEAVPADSGMAYVVIVHLDRDHESQMASLLQNRAKIPIVQVSSTFTPQPNHAYVIPPNGTLSAVDGVVELSIRDRQAPIDLFFRTLAQVYGPDAVGVVLSGSGSDGTAGMRWIRDAGGITIAQQPAEAEYDAMPRNAITSGQVDIVLPAGDIPGRLIDLSRTEVRLPSTPDAAQEVFKSNSSLARIIAALRRRTGHDFSGYKRSTLMRRLERRMRFKRIAALPEYARLLRDDFGEVDRLFQDLLISVSGFFRDPEAFEALARDVIPAIFAGKGPQDHVRAWVAGCATGEEAYSLAMLMSEHAATLSAPPRFQIFATDIDEEACHRARGGKYPATIAETVSAARLERFFDPDGDGVRVKESLREVTLFAVHDFLRDPPFSRLDLVSCRNVLIYLKPDAQQSVLRTFSYALLPGGFLFLGSSEFSNETSLFAQTDAKNRIYTSLAVAHRAPARATTPPLRHVPEKPGSTVRGGERVSEFSYGKLHLRMLEAYAAPSVIVDAKANIVHLSQLAGRFVRLPGGVPSSNLLDLLTGELRTALRAILAEALEKGTRTRATAHVEIDGLPRRVELNVSPLEAGGRDPYALVVFEEHLDVEADSAEAPSNAAILGLEDELRRGRAHLAATLEERDITVEELRSTNEELQSINEEHRTALEEMETSREELQSLNEELTTINQEHQATIDELKQTTGDLTNLVAATSIATVFLDRELCVRRFSPSAARIFSLTQPDHGRALAQVKHRLRYDPLIADAKSVLTSIEPVEREVRDDAGNWYSVRMRPYRSLDDRIEGVVITLYDVTEARHYREAEHDARGRAEAQTARLEALMQQIPAGVLVVDVPSGRILSANDRAHEIWGHDGLPVAASLASDGSGFAAFRTDGSRYEPEEWPVSRLIRTGRVVRDEEVEIEFPDGRRSVLLVNAAPVLRRNGPSGDEMAGAIVTFLDVTIRKRMEEDLRTAKGVAEHANRTKGLFMSTLSHEFRTPLNGILGYADLLAQDKRLDEQQKNKVERIQLAVRHLASMVEQILGLAGLAVDEDSARPTRLDARVTARAAVHMCDPVAAEAGLTLRLDLPDAVVDLTSDHNRLRMILVNLIGNAIKFTQQGEIRLEVRTHVDRATFTVHDTGIGIAPENHELVFERFWQVSKGLTRSGGGVGIGLAAAREFSRLLGGDIGIDSHLGGGSAFTLWLPLAGPRVVAPAAVDHPGH